MMPTHAQASRQSSIPADKPRVSYVPRTGLELQQRLNLVGANVPTTDTKQMRPTRVRSREKKIFRQCESASRREVKPSLKMKLTGR